jgi:hypothetical protein
MIKKARTVGMTMEFVDNGFSGSGALPPALAKRLHRILDDVALRLRPGDSMH